MSWVKLDDGFFRNRKARLAGKDGRALFLASCCYSAAALTDGHISAADLPVICADAEVRPAVAKKLVDVGLWDVVDDGWLIHDYLELNPSKDTVKASRQAAAERQSRFRSRRRNGVTTAVSSPSPSRPDPSPQGTGRSSTSTSVAPDEERGDEDDPDAQLDLTAALARAKAAVRSTDHPEGAPRCPSGKPWTQCDPRCPNLTPSAKEIA